ncbi:hypothetical protein Pcinc_016482 [Petrolisthes cinctipes]|uniref:Uncharacterized protein n=1 Tax=Petrolisthes cinctipes TaxID=88211 RepID=A0AAE1FTN0_PETCI|nr:hypothetical protein Pcinc_016482 [Petrolisthes cinctipes]
MQLGKEDRARLLLSRYSQRWVKSVSRGSITVMLGGEPCGTPPLPPRHCPKWLCPCQYIEDHLHYKPQGCFALCDVWQQGSTSVIIPQGHSGPMAGLNLA